MHIIWNKVTWYSQAAALLIFVSTFVLAFYLGVSWERAHVAASLLAAPVSTTASTTETMPATSGVGLGAHCGGFIKDAPTCAAGLRCQLVVSRPDTGGTCVLDDTTGAPIASSTSPTTSGNVTLPAWVGDIVVVTPQANRSTITLKKNERFAIRLGNDLNWSLSFNPKTSISRVQNSTTTDGFQGVYEAVQVGTTTLTALGRPICQTGTVCPQFITQTTVTFVIR